MSMDVVHILTRGRHALRGVSAHLVGERMADDPHRFSHIALHFIVDGEVPSDAVDRAIQLSREKYCSVWHSMRQDIEFNATFEVRSTDPSPLRD